MSTNSKPDNRGLHLLLACFLLGFFKIWLVRNFEIAARFMPADQSWYLNAAQFLLKGEWLGPYDPVTLLRQPGYPLWLAGASLAGVPLRLSSEWLLIASALVFAFTLARIGFSFWPCLLSYFLVLFQPEGFHLYNEILSDTFYGPTLLLSLSFLTLAFVNRAKRRFLLYSFAAGICFAALWNTRHENLLLIAPLGLFAAFLIRQSMIARSPSWGRCLIGIAIPLALIVAGTSGVRWMNEKHYGVAVSSEMLAPGFIAANSSLARIKRSSYNPFVPAPREIREKAYSVSPAFRELEPYLEGPEGKGWIHWGCLALGACEDISGGWFMMALREAVSQAGHYSSAPAAENFYRRLEDEINAACAQGNLDCYPPLTSRLGTYANIHNLPSPKTLAQASLRIFQLFWKSRPILNNLDNPALLKEPLRNAYDRIANRRPALAKMESFSLRGRAVNPQDPIEAIEIRDGNEMLVAESKLSGDRFELSPRLDFYDFWEPSLIFIARSGARTRIVPLEGGGASGEIHYRIEKLGGFRTPPRFEKFFFLQWTRLHDFLLRLLSGIVLLLLVLWIPFGKREAPSPEKALLYSLLASTILLRIAALALLDSTSFPVAQYYRLLYPIKILYDPLLLLCGFDAALALIKGAGIPSPGAGLFRKRGASTTT